MLTFKDPFIDDQNLRNNNFKSIYEDSVMDDRLINTERFD